ncbi:MAG: pirin family protein [Acidimicrobiia bacterium]
MEVELTEAREADVGGLPVRRALPRRGRRTVGAWCFVDHFGPVAAERSDAMQVGPHPHIGLQTVTWLLEGEVLHTDSLGTEQPIRPGQLNLMTAGEGIAHAESARRSTGTHGVQLWVAQPAATRHDAPAFEHHAELPQVGLGEATATVLVGEFDGVSSPARHDTALVGADLTLPAGTTTVPVGSGWEHALVVAHGAVRIDGRPVPPGVLAYLAPGRHEVAIGADAPARALLVGGEPFPEEVLMWWNFVARSRDEIDLARREWNDGSDRFGEVPTPLERIPAPGTPWPEPTIL